MRFAILTQYYPPEMGAPQARLSELARRFVERGHHVYVMTAMPNYPRGQVYPGYGGVYKRENQNGVTVIRSYIYPTKSVTKVKRLSNYFSFVGSSLVAGAAALPRVDFIMTESPPLFLGITGYLLSRLRRTRWIFNVSDLWPESAVRLGVIGEGASLELAKKLEAFCYRHAWLVTGQSREILQNLRQRFPRANTYHLSNGVDTQFFHPANRSDEWRQQIAKSTDCVVLYAGLHGIAQGLDQVLEAAQQLRDLKRLRIVLVGDGPEKAALINKCDRLALKNVEFRDPCERERMPGLLASADIAIVPLKLRIPGAVPSKLYEAMGAGLPVVLLANGEAARVVREAEAGIVVEPGDVSGLIMALRNLAENPKQRMQMGKNGRAVALRQFDRKTIADRFIDYLECHM